MQIEAQSAPKTTPQAVSKESEAPKSTRGGKRPGAGRKPNLAKVLLKGVSRETILAAVDNIDVGSVIIGLLKSKRERTKLETLIFVRDTLIGRPAQNVSLSGGVLHAHTTWGSLSQLSEEEMEMLDKLTKKLAGPVLDASPNAPQNQIESKPAIEAEVVASGVSEAAR